MFDDFKKLHKYSFCFGKKTKHCGKAKCPPSRHSHPSSWGFLFILLESLFYLQTQHVIFIHILTIPLFLYINMYTISYTLLFLYIVYAAYCFGVSISVTQSFFSCGSVSEILLYKCITILSSKSPANGLPGGHQFFTMTNNTAVGIGVCDWADGNHTVQAQSPNCSVGLAGWVGVPVFPQRQSSSSIFKSKQGSWLGSGTGT